VARSGLEAAGQEQLRERLDQIEVAEQDGADRALGVRLGVAARFQEPAVAVLACEVALTKHIH
jgi:hypothetical protein